MIEKKIFTALFFIAVIVIAEAVHHYDRKLIEK